MATLCSKTLLLAGLCDDPEAARHSLGDPDGWHLFGPFHSEAAALRWKEALTHLPAAAEAPPTPGWKYGFYYTSRDRRE